MNKLQMGLEERIREVRKDFYGEHGRSSLLTLWVYQERRGQTMRLA